MEGQLNTWYTIYTRHEPHCEWCQKALELLRVYGKDFYEIDYKEATDMFKDKGLRTVPQIFLEGHHIGGYLALEEFLRVEQEDKQKKRRS